nr:hypothetical protein Iba_chr06cCG18000 [Ipomoea batatas]
MAWLVARGTAVGTDVPVTSVGGGAGFLPPRATFCRGFLGPVGAVAKPLSRTIAAKKNDRVKEKSVSHKVMPKRRHLHCSGRNSNCYDRLFWNILPLLTVIRSLKAGSDIGSWGPESVILVGFQGDLDNDVPKCPGSKEELGGGDMATLEEEGNKLSGAGRLAMCSTWVEGESDCSSKSPFFIVGFLNA